MGTKFRAGIVVAGLGWFAAAGSAGAQESLAGAQALYASAQYEDALSALNRIRSGGVSSGDVPAIEQYRALCLLALGPRQRSGGCDRRGRQRQPDLFAGVESTFRRACDRPSPMSGAGFCRRCCSRSTWNQKPPSIARSIARPAKGSSSC